LRLKIK